MSALSLSINCTKFQIQESLFPVADSDIPNGYQPPPKGAISKSSWKITCNGAPSLQCSVFAYTEGLTTHCEINNFSSNRLDCLTANSDDPKYIIPIIDKATTQIAKIQAFVEKWALQNTL